jgi:methanogenic corrinoid protein MtbC1
MRPPPTNANGSLLTGRLRIAAVAELTGIPEPTLRAWERRYGVPRPERTVSGYRYYGPVEVQQIRNMQRLCESGVPAAEAARVVAAAAPPVDAHPAANARAETPHRPYPRIVDAIVDAVERFDLDALDEQLRSVMFLGSAASIIDEVLTPAMRAIGEKWHAGEVSVAQEHAASQRIGQSVRDLVRLVSPRDHHGLVLLGVFADDEHELGMLTTAARVAMWGFRPVSLGARTPPGAIRDAVEALKPKLVMLSVTIAPAGARGRELVDDYANACGSVPWIVGGSGVSVIADRVRAVGGHLAPEGAVEFEALTRELVAKQETPKKKRRNR